MKLKRTLAHHTVTGFLIHIMKRPILIAARQGLTQTLPLIIVGAAAMLLLNLPVIKQSLFSGKDSIVDWLVLCELIQKSSFNIASLAVLVSISSAYALQESGAVAGYGTDPITTTVVCLASYFVMITPVQGNFAENVFSLSGGLPIALCVAVTCAPLFIFLTRNNPLDRYFYWVGSDSALNNALASIPSGFITVFIFAMIRTVLEQAGFGDLHREAQSFFGVPFQGAGSSLATGIGYVALSQLFWLFGIHGPNMLFGVEQDILIAASQANISAISLGIKPSFILTKPFLDAFVHIGGSGSTLGLIIAIFLGSAEKNSRRLAFAALFPALFNVNEVILFGLPLVLNPVYAIPFMLAPVLQTLIAYSATYFHLVPMTMQDIHWTSPVIIGGYYATGSASGVILQLACLISGILVYLPFVKLSNSINNSRYQSAMNALCEAAEGTAMSPNGKKCIDLKGYSGQFARILAIDLAQAVELEDQLFTVYQPQIDTRKNQPVGAEALLRWKHPVYGLVPPHVAVALAEDTGIISKLGMKVLDNACKQYAAIPQTGQNRYELSVNISASQLDDELFAENVAEILERTGIPAQMLKLEITESIALTPESGIISMLQRLRDTGVRIAIDDFGMGHTSLRYLKALPVDTVKIDRSLTHASKDGVNDYIVTSIVSLCEAIGIEVLVEGIETVEQLERFRNHRCYLYQGYFFSKPLSIEDYIKYVEK